MRWFMAAKDKSMMPSKNYECILVEKHFMKTLDSDLMPYRYNQAVLKSLCLQEWNIISDNQKYESNHFSLLFKSVGLIRFIYFFITRK